MDKNTTVEPPLNTLNMNKTELLAVIYNNTSKDIQRDDIIDAVEKYLSASNIWVETDKGSFAIYKIESGASNPFISYVKQLAIPIESPTSTDTGQGKEVTAMQTAVNRFDNEDPNYKFTAQEVTNYLVELLAKEAEDKKNDKIKLLKFITENSFERNEIGNWISPHFNNFPMSHESLINLFTNTY